MTPERFNEIIEKRLELCKMVLCKKATEYAKGDRLHNFKVAAEFENCHPIKALGGMMAKHTVSVYDMIDDVDKGKTFSREMWEEKIGDSLNYLLLLSALVEEELDKDIMCDINSTSTEFNTSTGTTVLSNETITLNKNCVPNAKRKQL